MIGRVAVLVVAEAGICSAMPAGAEEVGVGVGPNGVTVGAIHGERDRDRTKTVIINKDRDHGDRDKTVIINKDRDHDRDRNRGSVVVEHD
jgi:hypothetical protein